MLKALKQCWSADPVTPVFAAALMMVGACGLAFGQKAAPQDCSPALRTLTRLAHRLHVSPASSYDGDRSIMLCDGKVYSVETLAHEGNKALDKLEELEKRR